MNQEFFTVNEQLATSRLLFLAEFLKPRIIPQRIEHWIQSEQRRSERPGRQCARVARDLCLRCMLLLGIAACGDTREMLDDALSEIDVQDAEHFVGELGPTFPVVRSTSESTPQTERQCAEKLTF